MIRVAMLAFVLVITHVWALLDQYDLEMSIYNDIGDHKVMLYSKTYCPYSKKMKAMLAKYDIEDMKTVELDKEEQMSEMQDYLQTLSGRRTVPQLYVDGRFVGGYDDTKVLEDDGELKKTLMQAGAIPWRARRHV